MQNRFAQSDDPKMAERLAKACLILADSGQDFSIINQLISVALTGKGDTLPRYALLNSGLAAYRQGDHSNAWKRMDQVLKTKSSDTNPDIIACLVQVMAQHGVGAANRARTALARGIGLTRTELPSPQSGSFGIQWNDWIITHALTIEARTLIEDVRPEWELTFQPARAERASTDLLAPALKPGG